MDEGSDRIARGFETPLLIAAVLTIPVTILQLLPPPDPWRTLADVLNWAIWLAFLAEAVVMLAVVPSRRRWLRENPVDVAIVLFTCPLLAVVIQSARVLRLVRLLRFLRLAPLVPPPKAFATPRYSPSSQHSPAAPPSHPKRISQSETASTGRSPR